MTVTLQDSQWESIVAAIEDATTSTLGPLLDTIDRANSKTRYYLYVKWLDRNAPKIVEGVAVYDWPPEVTHRFISYSPFTSAFVTAFVAAQTSDYAYILCTDDPTGEVGWKELVVFFA